MLMGFPKLLLTCCKLVKDLNNLMQQETSRLSHFNVLTSEFGVTDQILCFNNKALFDFFPIVKKKTGNHSLFIDMN